MARIAGVDLPKEKRVEIGLTYVFGIGRSSSNKILAEAGINPDTRVKDLTEEEAGKLRDIIDRDYTVEGDLRRNLALDIKRLQEIGCYRGIRHGRALWFAVRTLKPTQEPGRVRSVRLQTRRSKGGVSLWQELPQEERVKDVNARI